MTTYLKEYENEVSTYKKNERAYNDRIRDLENEILNLNEWYKNKKKSGEKNALRNEIIVKRSEIQALNSKITENEKQYKIWNQRKDAFIGDLQKEIQQVNTKNAENMTRIHYLLEDKKVFDEQLKNKELWRREILALHQKVNSLENEIKTIQTDNKKLNQDNSTLQKHLRALENENSQILNKEKETLRKLENNLRENKKLKEDIDNNLNEIRILKTDLNDEKKNFDNMERENRSLKKHYEEH